jgi:copper transport protein
MRNSAFDRGLGAVALSVMLVLATPVLSYAHATLVSAEPAAGSRLASSPPRIRLVFSEPLEPALGRISIVGSDGGSVKLSVAGDPHDVHALIASSFTLAAGAYRVRWRVVSADGHAVEGSYRFSVAGGQSAAVEPPAVTLSDSAVEDSVHTETSTSWGPTLAGAPLLPALLRGLAVGSLMAATGLLVFLAWAGGPDDTLKRRPVQFARWLTIAAFILLGLHLVAWILDASPEHQLTGDAITAALGSSVGKIELLRTGLALLAVWAIAVARRTRLTLPFALAALVVSGATGHSAAIYPAWDVPAKSLHLLAGGIWLGGLLWIVTIDRSDMARFASETSRVSSAALAAVLVIVLTGVIQTRSFLPRWLDLVESTYGIVTLAKVAGLLVLIAFGAHHRKRVVPRAHDSELTARFTNTVRQEIAVMTIVILLGGLLAYLAPPELAHQHMSTTSPTMSP